MTIMVVAGLGIVINTATALLFMRTRESDLNIRGAFLHMAAGALVPAGVVVPGTRGLFKQSLGHGHFAYCPHSGTGDATRPRE